MDGWFRTGDVATMDADGYMQIVDRTKDVIKSGGEWISSVTLENDIMGHPQVLEAAVIALPHPKWQERPIAFVVPKPEFRGTAHRGRHHHLSGAAGRQVVAAGPRDLLSTRSRRPASASSTRR